MTKRGADGFSLVFRSLPSIRFLRCVPLQRVRSGEECPKNCGERSSRIVAEYRGALAAGGFLVTSFRAKSRNLPCPAVIHVSVKMKTDVFVFRFPAVSRRPFMGLPERSLGCARDDETGSGWFLTRFQIAAIHPLPSVCPSSTSSQRGGMPEELRRAFFSYRQHYPSGEGCDTRIPSSKKGGEAATSPLNPEPNESIVKRGCEEMRIHFFTAPSCLL